MQYIFHLGRIYTISIAEIIKFVSEENVVSASNNFLITNIKEDLSKLEGQKLIDKMGGSIKISKILHKISSPNDIIPKIADHLIKNYSYNKKITYGINTYNIERNSGVFLDKILKTVKKDLQKQDLSARFVNKNFYNIEAPIVWKEKLNTDEGSEINIIKVNNDTYLSETLGLQNIDDYSFRDFEKPFRDSRTGMLPPKLAQILINLATSFQLSAFSEKQKTESQEPRVDYIIDPFCGSGTVLMEALLMGYNTIGSDINDEQIAGALTNINWLKQNFKIPETLTFDAKYMDATKFDIDRKIAKKSVITSEGYLGDPVKKVPEKQQIEWNFNQILIMHKKFLENTKRLGVATISICLPAYRKDHEYIFVKGFFEMIGKAGYKIENIFTENFLKKYPFLHLSKRNTLIYDRNDQIVAREIVVLKEI